MGRGEYLYILPPPDTIGYPKNERDIKVQVSCGNKGYI